MTGRKLTRNQARQRLGLSWDEFNELVESGDLAPEDIAGDHVVIPEQSVEDYERAHTRVPSVGGGPVLPLEIEDDYRRGKDA